MNNRNALSSYVLVAAGTLFLSMPVQANGQTPHGIEPTIKEDYSSGRLTWTIDVEYSQALLTVSASGGEMIQLEYGAKDLLALDLKHPVWTTLSDAAYTYELRLMRPVSEEDVQAEGRGQVLDDIVDGRADPAWDRLVSSRIGHFVIADGQFNTVVEEEQVAKDQLINDDLLVTGSLCVGTDCTNGESFGFDTIRLKENNVRIKFQDTSSTSSFPTTDWQITANDSANGGANRFSIDEVDGNKTPFTLEAGASSHSLYVDDKGHVGLGTSSPVVDLHAATGNTPTFRLEQNGSSGFTAQTWDVAGNEANFFVRDATNGSTLPFRIQPGAPSSSLFIAAGGNVGLGLENPSALLHIRRGSGTAKLLVEETSRAVEQRDLLELISYGQAGLLMYDKGTDQAWRAGLEDVEGQSDSFAISRPGTGGPELAVLMDGSVHMGPGALSQFVLAPDGDLEIAGTLSQGSSRALKENFTDTDSDAVLAKLRNLRVAVWNYKTDDDSVRHMGPTAEDFRQTFKLGADEKHLAPADVAGVALAAIQGLQEQVGEKDRKIDELSARIEQLECMVSALVDDRSSDQSPTTARTETSNDAKPVDTER